MTVSMWLASRDDMMRWSTAILTSLKGSRLNFKLMFNQWKSRGNLNMVRACSDNGRLSKSPLKIKTTYPYSKKTQRLRMMSWSVKQTKSWKLSCLNRCASSQKLTVWMMNFVRTLTLIKMPCSLSNRFSKNGKAKWQTRRSVWYRMAKINET